MLKKKKHWCNNSLVQPRVCWPVSATLRTIVFVPEGSYNHCTALFFRHRHNKLFYMNVCNVTRQFLAITTTRTRTSSSYNSTRTSHYHHSNPRVPRGGKLKVSAALNSRAAYFVPTRCQHHTSTDLDRLHHYCKGSRNIRKPSISTERNQIRCKIKKRCSPRVQRRSC